MVSGDKAMPLIANTAKTQFGTSGSSETPEEILMLLPISGAGRRVKLENSLGQDEF